MTDWVKVAEIKDLPAAPYSFEYANGSFYVGLVSNDRNVNKASGNIYKIVP